MSDELGTGRTGPERKREPWRTRHPRGARTAAVAGAAAFLVLLVWAPWWIEGHRLRDDNGELVSSAGIIVTGFRTMLVAIAAGGFTAAGLYYTREKHRLERENFQHAQDQFTENQKQFEITMKMSADREAEQARLTREGQVTGRYVEAIKLLSSQDDTQRLGAIYSLERIMRDSEDDHDTVITVLAAFIRQHAGLGLDVPRPDEPVQAAVTVLGRRPIRNEATRIDLRRTDLTGLDFERANFRRARLGGTDLRGANLHRADFTGVWAPQADFRQSYAGSTRFDGSNLRDAHFSMEQIPAGIPEFKCVIADRKAGTDGAG
ncbi:pentapeptide repeat-containing protein [Streptomyces sp. NBC_01460]|uniref:pentapeptide repeat-containing protein n=1 Tax=Streptomyces sp. NBC_01460 TaxID=2903875 RepID=UPI002E320787|nr:pentapeptide repeat-containing protein [Streptomyces sp. NBC_01460]